MKPQTERKPIVQVLQVQRGSFLNVTVSYVALIKAMSTVSAFGGKCHPHLGT